MLKTDVLRYSFQTAKSILMRYLKSRLLRKKTNQLGYERYEKICLLAYANESVFNTFKRHADYRAILEHVTKKQGQSYLDVIRKEGGDLLRYLNNFSKNDLYGKPFKFTYEIGEFSPTTLRYIKVLCDLKNIFGNLNNFNIIEIGTGYGGQCKIIADVFDYQHYTIVDLPKVIPLIKKYLLKLNVKKTDFFTPDELTEEKSCDLVISNYAFSECTRQAQDDYIKKILNNAKRGYITYNYDCCRERGVDSLLPYNKKAITQILSSKHTLRILEERPKTAPQNFIIVWDDR